MGSHGKPPPEDNPTPKGPPGNSDGKSPAVNNPGNGQRGGSGNGNGGQGGGSGT